jgi:hypothetical protein
MLPGSHAYPINGPFLHVMLHKAKFSPYFIRQSCLLAHNFFARESIWTPNSLAYEVVTQNRDRLTVGGCP